MEKRDERGKETWKHEGCVGEPYGDIDVEGDREGAVASDLEEKFGKDRWERR